MPVDNPNVINIWTTIEIDSGCQSTDGLGDVSVPGAGRRLPQPALIPLLAKSGPDCPENRLPMFLRRKDCTRQRRPVPKSAPPATLMRVSRPGVGDHFRSSRPSVKNHVYREGARVYATVTK